MARTNPGIKAAKNRSPTEIDSRSAIMINMMLGGIRIPSVPEAHMTPVANVCL